MAATSALKSMLCEEKFLPKKGEKQKNIERKIETEVEKRGNLIVAASGCGFLCGMMKCHEI